jgi:hypothetical protein
MATEASVTQGLLFFVFTNLIYGPLVGVIECGFEQLQGNSIRIELKSATNLVSVFCTTKCALAYSILFSISPHTEVV